MRKLKLYDLLKLIGLVNKKNILTLVKMVRKTLQDDCNRCKDHCNRGEKYGLTLNTAKTAGDS